VAILRSLFKLVYISFAVLFFATPAIANDLIIESASIVINKGTLPTDPTATQIGYLAGQDTINLDVALAVSWDCIPSRFGAQVCIAVKPTFNIQTSIGYQVGAVIQWQSLGTTTMLDTEVQYRNNVVNLTNLPLKQFTVQLSTPLVNQWIAQQYDANGGTGTFKLKITIDSDNTVIESNELNNTSSSPTADFIPLSGSLNFGALISTNIAAPISNPHLADLLVLENVVNCGATSGTTGLLNNLELTAKVPSWNPSPSTAGWSTVAPGGLISAGVASTLCTQFSLNATGDAFDLKSVDLDPINAPCAMPVTKTAYGSLGGFQVSIDADLCPDGAHPKPFTVDLPDGLTAHLPFFGTPIPRGYKFISFTPVSPVSDFNNLSATVGVGFLVSEAIPFSFNLNGGAGLTLSSAGLNGEFGSVVYAYDRKYAAADPRRLDRQGVYSNDSRYSAPAASIGALSITATGLQVPLVNFDAYNGNTHFPKMSSSWNAASVSIVDGKLTPGQTLGGGTYALAMSPDCPECSSSSTATTYSLAVAAETVANDGAVAVSVVAPTDPVWGPWDSAAVTPRNIFKRRGDTGLSGILYVPGNVVQGTGAGTSRSVADFLMGMRQVKSVTFEPQMSYALKAALVD